MLVDSRWKVSYADGVEISEVEWLPEWQAKGRCEELDGDYPSTGQYEPHRVNMIITLTSPEGVLIWCNQIADTTAKRYSWQ